MQYLLLCLVPCEAVAQSASLQMGGRAQGMGYASACLSDVWAMTGNVAGLAKTKTFAGAVSYHALPSFKSFNRMALAAALPAKSGVAGASIFRFGDDLYNEQVVSLGFANTYGLASLGLKGSYTQYRVDGIETRGAFSISFGGVATLTPRLSFGAHIVNINQPVINHLTGDRLPTRLLAGMALQLSEKLIVAAEIEKDLRQTPLFKGGLEYRLLKKITFRSGFNLHPQSGFFGTGFKIRQYNLDYALQMEPLLGLSHQASVTIAFREP